jgi:hypothetical protein
MTLDATPERSFSARWQRLNGGQAIHAGGEPPPTP